MREWFYSLLDLDVLRPGVEGVQLGFERPLPAWAWAGFAAASLLLASWSYSRLTGPLVMRGGLACVRAALLVVLLVLISGPQLVQRTETVERDWIIVLADRSASMTIADAPAGDSTHLRSREDQLRDVLARGAEMWSSLASDRVVLWLGFDGGAYDLAASDDPRLPADLGQPTGQRTSIGAALDQALARAAARPLAAVVVLSDGRSVSEPSRAAIRRLQSDRVPVHTIPLGSDAAISDLAVRRVEAPRQAFVHDAAPVRVELERLGDSAATASATVRLVDSVTGLVLAERHVRWTGPTHSLALATRPDEPGRRAWTVQLVPDGPDLVAANNSAAIAIELVDRPVRVLYIDGYPRWEQRYLRNLLIREQSITCSTLILAPERRYIQEGDVEIDSLPDSPERWAEYDAILIGDVSPDVFGDGHLTQLRDHVAHRGGGLLWIGGPSSTPVAWFDTPLGDLLPFTKDATDGKGLGEPVLLRPTPTAERLGILQLGESADEPWPGFLSDPTVGWSALQWVQRIRPDRLKPTAEVLASDASTAAPIVLSMRYGGGRSIYVATDEIWRWRYGRGEVLPERFWLQIIRLLAREGLARAGRPAVIDISPRRADVDQPVRLALELLDQALVEQRLPAIQVRLTRRAAPGDSEPPLTVELSLRPDPDNPRRYAAVWLPREPGIWDARPIDPALTDIALVADVQVSLPDDELRRPETDHALLRRLSDETGGTVIPVSDLSLLPERIPNRKIRLLNERTESLWDTPLALLVVLILATLEWVGRRVIRLI